MLPIDKMRAQKIRGQVSRYILIDGVYTDEGTPCHSCSVWTKTTRTTSEGKYMKGFLEITMELDLLLTRP